jgi:phosphoenolpyruvate-protein kinase (PTS system EI component)
LCQTATPDTQLLWHSPSGLVCEVGGRLSHTCIVALEMGIPCITQADCALELLEPLDYVWLDANEGVVYAIM